MENVLILFIGVVVVFSSLAFYYEVFEFALALVVVTSSSFIYHFGFILMIGIEIFLTFFFRSNSNKFSFQTSDILRAAAVKN